MKKTNLKQALTEQTKNQKVSHTVVPEGWGTGIENFNSTFQHIHNEWKESPKDARHYQTNVTQYSLN